MPRPLPPGTWPKASDEADGNAGRPRPGFFRITGKKYFVLYRSQAQNISYSIDHRQKIRILPKRYFGLYLLVGGRKRLVFYLSQVIKISYSTENGGRSQTSPGRFLRGLGPRLQMKLMVIPVGRSLVFSGSQAINISYSTSGSLVFPDHRQKIFRTLPITGKTLERSKDRL